METNNLFSDGMDTDISKFFLAKNKYLQAYNFRATTELGESNGGLVNIRGNECAVKFPTMRPTYKIKVLINTATVFTDTATVTVNGQTTAAIPVNSSTTGLMIYNAIKVLSNCYLTNPSTGTFTVAYKDDYVVISQIPVYVDCTRTDSSALTISITDGGGAVNFLRFYDFAGTAYATQFTGPTDHYYVNAITTNRIIGHTFILDDIYLFTADQGTNPVNDSNTGLGAIWKLSYNESTKVTTLTLIYSQWLDFNENYPIAPSAATGRYESDPIQRIYWSDFYNKVRTINTADPQLMALNPKLTSVIPSVGFDIPILNEIIGGSLPVGTYELCYRLKQSLGAVSNYSSLSNFVHLINVSPSTFLGYEGVYSGGSSGNGIRWTISNIDTKFDRIEYVLLHRTSKTDIAKVYIVSEDNIPNTGTVNLDVTSLPDDEITLDEFLALNSTFTHTKTVDTKDNRLFWGNVKVKQGSLGTWDARAFRALTSNAVSTDIQLTNNGTNSAHTLAQAIALPETSDTINEYYTNTGAFSTNACYFKPNTAGGILGGKGANISYEFGTYSIELNTLNRTENSDDSYNIYTDLPFRECENINPSFSFASYDLIRTVGDDSPNQIYPIRGNGSMKNPYRTSVIKGFQHEEIYRFGIQLFDLEGLPLFTKWIGDIKMPTFGDLNNNPDSHASGMGIADFRLSYLNGSGTQAAIYGQILYIKFTVDVTALADTCSGYKIVRMERLQDSDKTILGCGLITPTFTETPAGNDVYLPACWYYVDDVAFPAKTTFLTVLGPVQGKAWNPYPNQRSWETLSVPSNAITPSGGTFGAAAANVKTFDCFDFNIGGGVSYATGDKLFIRGIQRSENYSASKSGGIGQAYRWWYSSGGSGSEWYGLPADGGGTKYTVRQEPVGDLTPAPNAWNAAAGFGATAKLQSGYDDDEMAYYLHMYVDDILYGNFATVSGTAAFNKTIDDAEWVGINATTSTFAGGRTFHNYGRTFGDGASDTLRPAVGASTLALEFNTGFNDYDAAYGASSLNQAQKLMALYYKPNNAQYGGATYSARAGNEYISCGSYIPIKRDDITLTNNLALTIDTFGGDVHLNYWDIQKVSKNIADGSVNSPKFRHYNYQSAVDAWFPGATVLAGSTTNSEAHVSVTYFFPCTSVNNQEVRFGDHINTSLNVNTYIAPDEYLYASYHSNERDVVKYFSEPIDFVETDKWVNRVYYSEVKFNNETLDSWQAYKTNNFYDVEGNYGPINCLISLREELYYIQERAFGQLLINPITTISGDNGLPVTLGKGATVEKHRNLALDVGTKHQWSVYRSQSAITWIDVRSKKIYMFDGTIKSISDSLGQRNFVIKRLHPDLIINDNPILKKGIITTYDYYHNEFLYTFTNDSATNNNDEAYTLVYSEPIGKFTGLYSFLPPIYLNNNRYLFSIDPAAAGADIGKIWVHNYGNYCNFYGTVNDSLLKVLVNDNPLNTKVFDNLSWNSQSIADNLIWIDDLITPNASATITTTDNVNYIDDTFSAVRCYNEWENTDWTTLTVNTNLKKREQNWSTVVPRNKVNYDTFTPPVNIFTPANLTKTDFGERMRDKWMIVDLRYTNTPNRRFIVHNLKTTYRISSR